MHTMHCGHLPRIVLAGHLLCMLAWDLRCSHRRDYLLKLRRRTKPALSWIKDLHRVHLRNIPTCNRLKRMHPMRSWDIFGGFRNGFIFKLHFLCCGYVFWRRRSNLYLLPARNESRDLRLIKLH